MPLLLLLQGQKFEYLLNTGNMVSKSGLDLSQATGFTVVAEKLNFYRCACSTHFRTGQLILSWLTMSLASEHCLERQPPH